MTTLEKARQQAELVDCYDAYGIMISEAGDNESNAVSQIVDSLSESYEGSILDPGDDLNELKKQSALIASQYYLDGVRKMRDKIGEQLTADGVDLNAPASPFDADEPAADTTAVDVTAEPANDTVAAE